VTVEEKLAATKKDLCSACLHYAACPTRALFQKSDWMSTCLQFSDASDERFLADRMPFSQN
jgi:hypothetical protein